MINKKSRFVIYSFLGLVVFLFVEVAYIYGTKSMSREGLSSKREFVGVIQLPDLAISTEAFFIRHRALSDFFSAYRDDGTLREYFASTFVFSRDKNEK
ncbi:hypothetical protein [Sulfurimonas sp.]|uniref:hypothetical protein n=1 Tax=Sulfurimonas sp. TaxID=2022749 RepID=UPI0025F5B1F8|nr:hypothetical protein [Sulfurimonas sp.]MDD5156589.1 hypothetical protein [Sulfurimonas sp.]